MWHRMMDSRREMTEAQFLMVCDVAPILDEGETWEQYKETAKSDPIKFYQSVEGLLFFQTAGFEFIWLAKLNGYKVEDGQRMTIFHDEGETNVGYIREQEGRYILQEQGEYVLAYYPLKHELITWLVNPTLGGFYYGHYFKAHELRKAEQDLSKRGLI